MKDTYCVTYAECERFISSVSAYSSMLDELN